MKLFVFEVGTDSMIRLLERGEDRLFFTSALTVLEVRSAIRRRQYAKDIADLDAERAIDGLLQEAKRLIEHPITASVLLRASALVDRHNLRALDSVQLATALLLNEERSIVFVSSDQRLLRAARDARLDVLDPCSMSAVEER